MFYYTPKDTGSPSHHISWASYWSCAERRSQKFPHIKTTSKEEKDTGRERPKLSHLPFQTCLHSQLPTKFNLLKHLTMVEKYKQEKKHSSNVQAHIWLGQREPWQGWREDKHQDFGVYLDVSQGTPKDAEVWGFLVVNVGDVALKGLKALFQMRTPAETEPQGRSHFKSGYILKTAAVPKLTGESDSGQSRENTFQTFQLGNP